MRLKTWRIICAIAAAGAMVVSTGLGAQNNPDRRAADRNQAVRPNDDAARALRAAAARARRGVGALNRAIPGRPPAGALGRERRAAFSRERSLFLPDMTVFDKDGDGALSRQEFENGALDLFAVLDADGNGKLETTEMTGNLQRLWLPPASRAREIMRTYDVNRDNKITAEECLLPPKAFAQCDSNKSGALESEDLTKLSLLQTAILMNPQRRGAVLLAELDSNKDGVLTSDEFKLKESALREADKNSDGQLDATELKTLPPLPPNSPRRQAQELIARLDEDGDKMLAENEFRRSRVPFDTVDKNKDGLLDLQEVTAWIESGQGRRTRLFAVTNLADRMIGRYDKNNDGKLTKDELQAMPEAMWKRWDLNADGTVERKEIEDAILSPRGGRRAVRPGVPPPPIKGGVRPAGPRGKLMGRDPAEILKADDQDEDGKLTAEEIGLDPRVFRRIDTDGDGRLTVEEIAAGQEMFLTKKRDARKNAEKYREKGIRQAGRNN